MQSQASIQKGLYFAIATSVISGFSIFINKYAVSAVSPPLLFTIVKNVSVGVLCMAILIFSRKWNRIQALDTKERIMLLMVATIGGALPFYLFFTGLSQIPAINAALIHKTLVIWVAMGATIFLKERISAITIMSIAILVFAQNMMGGFTGFMLSTGEGMVLVATVLWSLETIIAKRVLHTVDPDIVASARMGLGSLMLLGAGIITAPETLNTIVSLNLTQWAWIAVTSALLTGYVSAWYRALALAPATMVTAVLVLSTIITNILSAVLVTHTWNSVFIIQTLLITGAIAMMYVGLKQIIAPNPKHASSIA